MGVYDGLGVSELEELLRSSGPQERYDILIVLSKRIYKKDPERAEALAREAVAIAGEAGREVDEAKARDLLGMVLGAVGEYSDALDEISRSLEVLERYGLDFDIARCCNNLALVHRYLGDHARSIELFHRSLRIKERIGDLTGEAATWNNLFGVYDYLKDYDTALVCIDRAIALAEEADDERLLPSKYNNKGSILVKKGEFREAERYLRMAMEMNHRSGNVIPLIKNMHNYSEYYIASGDYDEAEKCLGRMLELSREHDFEMGLVLAHGTLAELYDLTCDVKRLREHASSCLEANDGVDMEAWRLKALHLMGKGDAGLGRYREACDSLLGYIDGIGGLEVETRSHEVARIEARADYEHRLRDRLRKVLHDIILTMTRVVEMKDPYTAGHQENVARLSEEIGRRMGLDPDRLEGLRIAATLHDIGKVFIPAEILAKPGRLNDMEMALIKMHPRSGYDLLSSIEFPWTVAEFVLQHHEKLDGSGYPQGLSGDGILLEARIISVSDVVEAMSMHRPYRPALGAEKALATVREMAPEKLDIAVVEACGEVFEEGFNLRCGSSLGG